MAETQTSSLADETDRRRSALMAAAQTGDRTAYEALLRDCLPMIRLVIRRQGVAPDSIDDVVQETLLTLHRARHTYDPARSFNAWLATIARRRAIDEQRFRGRRMLREDHDPGALEDYPDLKPDADALVTEQSRMTLVSTAMQSLTPRQREAIEQLALRDRSLAEASLATGRSKGSLKVNLHRALHTLREKLAGKD